MRGLRSSETGVRGLQVSELRSPTKKLGLRSPGSDFRQKSLVSGLRQKGLVPGLQQKGLVSPESGLRVKRIGLESRSPRAPGLRTPRKKVGLRTPSSGLRQKSLVSGLRTQVSWSPETGSNAHVCGMCKIYATDFLGMQIQC